MSWNHRVIRYKEGTLGIHEVYYDQYGAADMVTTRAVGILGDNLEEIELEIARFLIATTKPILDMSQFEAGEKNRGEA
jgi:hypothetical protein